MEIAIVAIGDEILIGQVTDTNSVFIAQQMTEMGHHIVEMLSISDTPEHIVQTLNRLVGSTDLILMTGGLGPTKDDLTKETLNEYFGGTMHVDEVTKEKIEGFFRKRGRKMIASNEMQAMVPDVCTVLPNNFGTAPGMWFRKNGTNVISMPGVPYEMKPMVSDEVIPRLKEMADIPELYNKTIMTIGVPESYLAEKIEDWEDALPECMKLAYLPRPGIVRLRITVTGKCVSEAQGMMSEQVEKLKEIIGENIFAYEDVLLEQVIGKILKEEKYTVSTAESCTGGNIARLLTSVSGSSSYFKGSVIAYSNEVKEGQLGVPAQLIEKHGAVSKEVVEMMAVGAQKTLRTDIAIAVSGIAGPDGGTEDKPVGTVWIAVAVGEELYSEMNVFGGHRALVVEQTSIKSLGIVRNMIVNKVVNK